MLILSLSFSFSSLTLQILDFKLLIHLVGKIR